MVDEKCEGGRPQKPLNADLVSFEDYRIVLTELSVQMSLVKHQDVEFMQGLHTFLKARAEKIMAREQLAIAVQQIQLNLISIVTRLKELRLNEEGIRTLLFDSENHAARMEAEIVLSCLVNFRPKWDRNRTKSELSKLLSIDGANSVLKSKYPDEVPDAEKMTPGSWVDIILEYFAYGSKSTIQRIMGQDLINNRSALKQIFEFFLTYIIPIKPESRREMIDLYDRQEDWTATAIIDVQNKRNQLTPDNN